MNLEHKFRKENQELCFRYFKFEISVRHPSGSVKYTLEILSYKFGNYQQQNDRSVLGRSKKRGLSLSCAAQYSSH